MENVVAAEAVKGGAETAASPVIFCSCTLRLLHLSATEAVAPWNHAECARPRAQQTQGVSQDERFS